MDMENRFTPGTAVNATSTVEVSISCRDLLDKDIFSRSDPMCVVYKKLGTRWIEILRTETIWDNLNPDFATKVTIDYIFEEEQPLRFEIYDIDNTTDQLQEQDFLGFAECTLGKIIAHGHNGLTLRLSQNSDSHYPQNIPESQRSRLGHGQICLLAEELVQLKEEVTLQIRGHNFSGSLFFSPKTFFTLSKVNEAGKFVVVYRSESYSGKHTRWQPFTLPVRAVCNGDRDRALQIECFREGINGYHKSVGSVKITLNQIKSHADSGTEIQLTNSDGKMKKGWLSVSSCKISPIYTFVEYIQNGTELHCCFAIDFTASNGDPNIPNSLHHFSAIANRPNPYEQAILAVADIIQDYDRTRLYPVYGFGARVPPAGNVSHCFPINLTGLPSPYCREISGVLEAYKNCIQMIQLCGPTCFAPLIHTVASIAAQNMNGLHYYVLLIITDGLINDMDQTTEAIVNASTLPLSIIIVGVGGADFREMEVLDGDTVRLSHKGKEARRDIVQFVPYRDAYSWLAAVSADSRASWGNTGYEDYSRIAKAKLAQEVLAEIPVQLTSFMKSMSFSPRPQASSVN